MSAGDFKNVGGCESGFATPEPGNPNVIWSGCYQGVITRVDMRDGQVRDVSAWPDVYDGWAAKDVKERWHWTVPLTISPFNPKKVYIGSQFVHETTDGGQTWKTISPDLTLNDKKDQGNSGGITNDNLYTYDASIVYAIAASPVKEGLLWVGTNDGQVQISQDDGGHWTNLTKNIPDLGPMGTIWSISASPYNAGTAYIAVNRQQMADYNTYVYKTSDFGKTWTMISGGIPKSVNGSAHIIVEDPVRKGMLYLGTDNAIYVSWDDGGHWTQLNNNLPPAPVYWIAIQRRFNDLVISTYGRGDFILDDITALREIDKFDQGRAPHLFKPRDAYRFRTVNTQTLQEPGTRVIGRNPPYGADINFYLPSDDPHASIVVSGADGKVIRTLSVDAHAGLNRAWWDLRAENGAMPHMLVSPPGESWFKNGPQGYHILTGIMIPNTVHGPLVLPGSYTIKLTAGGQTVSAPLTVLADPHTLGTAASMRTQHSFETEVVSEIDKVSSMIEQMERVRDQVEKLAASGAPQPVIDAGNKLAEQAVAIEGKLIDIHLTDGNEDLNRNPSQLYQKLTALYDKDEADLGPTAPEVEVNKYFVQWMGSSETELKAFEAKDVPAFNQMLKSKGVSTTIEP
jgi:hypothetical protein